MTGQHAHARINPAHKRKPLVHCCVEIDGTGTKAYRTPEEYESEVASHLGRIMLCRTGQAVFPEFANGWRYQVRIIPYEVDAPRAYAVPKDEPHALKKGQLLYQYPDDDVIRRIVYDRYGHPVAAEGSRGRIVCDRYGRPVVGKGGGSEATIRFTPKMFTKYCNQEKDGHKSGAQPDEALFHEMVHATRVVRGIESTNPIPVILMKADNDHYDVAFYDNEEEFFAVLLTNIYTSETGRPSDLRLDHSTFRHLTDDADAKFLPKRDIKDVRYRLVSKLVHEDLVMAHRLEAIPTTVAPFNPIRRYFDLQRAPHPHRR